MLATTFVLALALVAVPTAEAEERNVSVQFANLLEACEYRDSGGSNQSTKDFRYRLFVPRNMKSGERYPLLLWLHGQGDGGLDNHRSLKQVPSVLKDPEHVEKYRFFILVPQCPSSAIGWTSRLNSQDFSPSEPSDMLTLAHRILQKTMREQPVDPDRVYLVGICSGGNACWEMAMRHPELFAAVVPTTPRGGDLSRASRLAKVPIWAFQSQYDHPASVLRMVSAVKAAGGNIHLTLGRGAHDSWSEAFHVYGVMDWMLEQRRGARVCWTPPGHRNWKWWHIFAVPIGFLAVVVVSWHSEQKKRRQRRTTTDQYTSN